MGGCLPPEALLVARRLPPWACGGQQSPAARRGPSIQESKPGGGSSPARSRTCGPPRRWPFPPSPAGPPLGPQVPPPGAPQPHRVGWVQVQPRRPSSSSPSLTPPHLCSWPSLPRSSPRVRGAPTPLPPSLRAPLCCWPRSQRWVHPNPLRSSTPGVSNALRPA